MSSVVGHLADHATAGHNGTMKPVDRWNLGVGVVGLTACACLNVWVFRFGMLYGLVGLNLTKHVGVAVLCQAIGVNKAKYHSIRRRTTFQPAHESLVGPHSPPRDLR